MGISNYISKKLKKVPEVRNAQSTYGLAKQSAGPITAAGVPEAQNTEAQGFIQKEDPISKMVQARQTETPATPLTMGANNTLPNTGANPAFPALPVPPNTDTQDSWLTDLQNQSRDKNRGIPAVPETRGTIPNMMSGIANNINAGMAKAREDEEAKKVDKLRNADELALQKNIEANALAAQQAADKATFDANMSNAQGVEGTGYQNTAMGTEVENQVMNDLQGEGTEVTAARNSLERDKALRLSEADRMGHEKAIQMGFRPGTQQYDEIVRNAQNDAVRQNIEAENQVNEFARTNRMGVRDDAIALDEIKYGRYQDEIKNTQDKLATYAKFLPSDKAQQMLVLNELSGGNFEKFFASMYDSNGELLSVYQDPSKSDTALKNLNEAFSSVNVHPDTKESWSPVEKEAYIQELWSDIQANIYNPVTDESTRKDDEAAGTDRVQTFLDNGSTTGMLPTDWTNMTQTQRSDLAEKAIVADVKGVSWGNRDGMNKSEARKEWKEKNPPMPVGTVVKHNNRTYVITVPYYENNFDGEHRSFQIKGIDTSTGEDAVIFESEIFEKPNIWEKIVD